MTFWIGHGEESPVGRSSRARRGDAKQFLEVGPDAHGVEEVEEDHGAVGGVIPWQAAVVHPLDERDGREGKLGDGAALEEGVEEAKTTKSTAATTAPDLMANESSCAASMRLVWTRSIFFARDEAEGCEEEPVLDFMASSGRVDTKFLRVRIYPRARTEFTNLANIPTGFRQLLERCFCVFVKIIKIPSGFEELLEMLISWQNFRILRMIALLFVFDKYCPIID